MHLEIITHTPKKDAQSTPLLFVHGACHGAWCWENFLPYFAECGYEAHAVSLRGHGRSDGHERILVIRTEEYVEDVANAASRLRNRPVLIGHSMGGYVVQKYLENHGASGAVLMAPVPVTGSLKMLLRMGTRFPWRSFQLHLTRRANVMVGTPDQARELLFSSSLPSEAVNRHFARLQNESYAAGLETAFERPQPAKVGSLPMLVLGAADDALFSPAEIKATAQAYKAQTELFPDMAHDMMLDTDWRKAAERILTWLQEQGL